MTIETIKLATGAEQEITILYGEINYRFEIAFNDFKEYWFVDVYNDDTGDQIAMGMPLYLHKDAFAERGYLGLGKLLLIDSEPENTDAINIKDDLGDRIQLVREI